MSRTRAITVSITLALLVFVEPSGLSSAQSASSRPTTRAAEPAAARIDRIISGAPERWSIRVVSVYPDVPIYEHNPGLALQPASNEKALTTAVALARLGPDWTTRTSVYATSVPDGQGVVHGNLILYGRGDPNLSDRLTKTGDKLHPMRVLVEQLRARGISRIEGDLVADESYLAGPPHGSGWGWSDLQWHFGAEVSALSFNDNMVEVQVVPGPAPGQPGVVRLNPDIGYVEVLNTSETTSGGPARVAVRRSIDKSRIEVTGTLPTNYVGWTGEVAVHEPARFTAAAFRRALADSGIEVSGRIRRLDAYAERPPEYGTSALIEVASLESRPLSELIRVINKMSQNLHAELLLRLIGRLEGPDGMSSDEAGVAVILAFLNENGVDTADVVVHDGSGLSRLNRLSATTLERSLAVMDRHAYRSDFVESLPKAGVDGTLRGRLRGVDLRAKTGSLTTAKSLSGYLKARSGDLLTFSIIYNAPGSTSGAVGTIDRIVAAIAEGF